MSEREQECERLTLLLRILMIIVVVGMHYPTSLDENALEEAGVYHC